MRPLAWICTTCGTQYPETKEHPDSCPVCEDARQWVPPDGLEWTHFDELCRGHDNTVERVEERLLRIGTDPGFAIGQSAFLLGTDDGNYLWDLVPVLDDSVRQLVQGMGGLEAIAISHPHYQSTLVEWSSTFGDVPVYVHADDRRWIQRPWEHVVFWEGETLELSEGLTLIRCGGHFPGASVLHWTEGADGTGALLSGDTIQVVMDREWVSFMYSYPNLIPLSGAAVRRIVKAVEPYEFERIYGAFERTVMREGNAVVHRSAQRYLAALEGVLPD